MLFSVIFTNTQMYLKCKTQGASAVLRRLWKVRWEVLPANCDVRGISFCYPNALDVLEWEGSAQSISLKKLKEQLVSDIAQIWFLCSCLGSPLQSLKNFHVARTDLLCPLMFNCVWSKCKWVSVLGCFHSPISDRHKGCDVTEEPAR